MTGQEWQHFVELAHPVVGMQQNRLPLDCNPIWVAKLILHLNQEVNISMVRSPPGLLIQAFVFQR